MMNISEATNILDSPVVATLLAIIASGVAAAVVGVYRALSRLSLLETQIGTIAKDVSDLKHDMDVIKWGAVAGAQLNQMQQYLKPGDQT